MVLPVAGFSRHWKICKKKLSLDHNPLSKRWKQATVKRYQDDNPADLGIDLPAHSGPHLDRYFG